VKNVLCFQHPWRFWRVRLAGIYRYATRARWQMQLVEDDVGTMSVREAIAFFAPDGCIVNGMAVGSRYADIGDFGDIPVVVCDPTEGFPLDRILAVSHDSAETAAIAAGELSSLGVRAYGFVGYIHPRDWSDRRRDILAGVAAAEGVPLHVFDPGRPNSLASFFAGLRAWLRNLPHPCGILGANDTMANFVLQACARERLRVPEDVAVVGIDNDELLCEHSSPTLTSVSPDFEQSGFLAAQLLDEAMAGCVRPPHVVAFRPTHIVRRNSTRKFARRDDAVRHALETIARRACDGLTPAEVCREIGGSRRQAETRFRALAGRSVGEEIAAVRIARAKTLLLRKDHALETLHGLCGYGTPSSLRRAFKKATGLSLRQWRKAQSGHSSENVVS